MADLEYNVYCDESCHLEQDHQPIMALGGVWCERRYTRELSSTLWDLKERHRATGELKWTKVSRSRHEFYRELVDWFFTNDLLHFRAVVVLHKDRLDHVRFNDGSHDNFYYKMYFSLLSKILDPDNHYFIYASSAESVGEFRFG